MAPPLVEDLIEEVLLRLPPDDPKRLLRAALVCKGWRRVVSDPGFRRRFRERHRRAPPLLGFLYYRRAPARFVPTTPFRPPPADGGCTDYLPLDARHGRVLLLDVISLPPQHQRELVVWDPKTADLQRVPMPRFARRYSPSWSAGFHCAAPGCDHLDCGGPFLIVFVANDDLDLFTRAYVYSSEAGAWSELTCAQHVAGHSINRRPCALVGNALYFLFEMSTRVLKYDLGTGDISVIELPSAAHGDHIVLTAAEDGGLGFATVIESTLFLWSRDDDGSLDADMGWSQRFIELDDLLPDAALVTSPVVVGFAEGVGVILLRTFDGFFSVDLKSGCVRKIAQGLGFYDVLPYVNFYTPVLGAASSSVEPRVSASTPITN